MTSILGTPMVGSRDAACWAASRGAPLWFCNLTEFYWAPDDTGVRPDVAFAQACKETGFGKLGRAVTREHNNYCGLKVPAPMGPDDNPDDHFRFGSPSQGVRAHKEHLALYAGSPGYPKPYEKIDRFRFKGATSDPRHFSFILGAAKDVEDLGGETPADQIPDWAPSPDYGLSIVRDYLIPMIHFVWS